MIVRAIGEAMMPPSALFPGYSDAALARAENELTRVPLFPVIRGMLVAIEAGAVARYGRVFSRLDPARRLAWLQRWANGPYAERAVFRVLAMFVKLGYYDDPALFAVVGREYEKPPVKDEPQRWWQLVTTPDTITDDLEFEADAVVVGTGAGGAVVAARLAEAGHAVVMLEQGNFHRRSEFTSRPMPMQRLMYEDQGSSVVLGNVAILMPYGRCVGGTTTINSGTCFRTPCRTLREWCEQHGLTDYTPQAMEPYFRYVEDEYRVTPAEAKYIGASGEIIARGAQRLGYAHGPLRRNAPDCDGQGTCAWGCPSDAKRSTNVSFVPRALAANAFLVTGTEVDTVLVERGRAVGVSGFVAQTGKRVTVRARVAVLAGGAISTPLLLMKNGLANSSGQLGRNLSIHPSAGLFALNEDVIESDKSIPQGYGVTEFEDEDLLFENAHFPFDIAGMVWPEMGAALQETMEQYQHFSLLGFIIKETSRGVVRPGLLTHALMTYHLNQRDTAKIVRGITIAARIMLASGARTVYAPVHGWRPMHGEADLQENLRRRIRARDLDVTAYHPLGTCRMGHKRRDYVCNPHGETWDVKNLFVADGAAIPPALGVNPMITISAVAARIADVVAERIERLSRVR